MRTEAEITQIIDEAIKSIWVNEIRNDYENKRLLKEFGGIIDWPYETE